MASAAGAPTPRGTPQEITVVSTVRRASVALAVLSGLSIVGLMLLTSVDVVLRALVGSGVDGSIEIAQVALVATVFAGVMSSEVAHVHVRTPLLTERLSPRVARLVRACGSVIAIGIVGWSAIGAWRVGLESARNGEFQFGLTQIPIWPAKLIVAIGLTGLLAALALNLYLGLRRDAAAPVGAQGAAT